MMVLLVTIGVTTKSKYPTASEIGKTGIGDTPYVIDENNVDHYPLIYSVGAPEINVTCTENAPTLIVFH
ncbi:MAG: hypothetical protein ACQCN5_00580 [Candidatus Bathyarchaeia archaeon]|jgi:hypothetical protein